MTHRRMAIFAFALAIAPAVFAQTKISGTAQCAKADPFYKIDVGDAPGHAWVLSKGQCTWTKAIEMGGLQTKDGVSASIQDVTATKTMSHGTHVGTMANGDRYFVKFQDTMKMKDGAPDGAAKGTYTFTGGTGKMKGLKGKGTYTAKPNADGTAVLEVEGEYELGK